MALTQIINPTHPLQIRDINNNFEELYKIYKTRLPLSGGTLSGSLDIGGHALKNEISITSNTGNNIEAYPDGMSYAAIGGTNRIQNTGANFPGYGTLFTVKRSTGRNFQIEVLGSGIPYFRVYYDSAWTDWGQVITDAPTAWNDFTLQNGWVNYGGSYTDASYRKVGNRVFLRGLIKSGTIGAVAATLPEGYRPSSRLVIPTVSYSGGYQSSRLDIFTTGQVTPQAGGIVFFSLDSVSFFID